MNPSNDQLERYRIAIDTRNFEIQLFWQRSLFFAAFISAIFVGYTSEKTTGFSNIMLACLGFLISLAWSLANRGSKYWYESWESKINDFEKTSEPELFLPWKEPQKKFFLYQARLYSVSKIAIYVTDLILITWLFILLKEINTFYQILEITNTTGCLSLFLLGGFILVAILVLIFGTRTSVPPETKNKWTS